MRLLVHVEGQTEETFVNTVLAPYLYGAGYSYVAARMIGSARNRNKRGGARSWQSVLQGILHHLKSDPETISTMMVDYYGMPQWPGRECAARQPFAAKADTVQQAIDRNVCDQMGAAFNPARFIAYVSMHEFEALLFSDCDSFARSIEIPDVASKLQCVLDSFGGPEEIDDSPNTAPSKRILDLVPTYDKVTMGTVAIQEIGLANIRSRCHNFDRWLARLELATQGT